MDTLSLPLERATLRYLRAIARRHGYADLVTYVRDAAMRRAVSLTRSARTRKAARTLERVARRKQKTGASSSPTPASSKETTVAAPERPRPDSTAPPHRRQERGTEAKET